MSGKTARKKRQTGRESLLNSPSNKWDIDDIYRLSEIKQNEVPVIVSSSSAEAALNAADVGLSAGICAEIQAIFHFEASHYGPDLMVAVGRINKNEVLIAKVVSNESADPFDPMVKVMAHDCCKFLATSPDTLFEKANKPLFFVLDQAKPELISPVAKLLCYAFDACLEHTDDEEQKGMAA